eukprot:6490874-Amphidinium_carterae.2
MSPPPLNRGRSNPYGPIAGRVPVTPTELAGGTPVPEDDDMGMGGPDNPIAMTELVAPHRDLKRYRRQVDRCKLLSSMLNNGITVGATRLEYSRARTSQLEEVGRHFVQHGAGRERLQKEVTQLQYQLQQQQHQTHSVTEMRDEQLLQLTQSAQGHRAHTDQDVVLRTELASAQENLSQLHTTQLNTVNSTRAHQSALRRVETTEASLREVEVLASACGKRTRWHAPQAVAAAPAFGQTLSARTAVGSGPCSSKPGSALGVHPQGSGFNAMSPQQYTYNLLEYSHHRVPLHI